MSDSIETSEVLLCCLKGLCSMQPFEAAKGPDNLTSRDNSLPLMDLSPSGSCMQRRWLWWMLNLLWTSISTRDGSSSVGDSVGEKGVEPVPEPGSANSCDARLPLLHLQPPRKRFNLRTRVQNHCSLLLVGVVSSKSSKLRLSLSILKFTSCASVTDPLDSRESRSESPRLVGLWHLPGESAPPSGGVLRLLPSSVREISPLPSVRKDVLVIDLSRRLIRAGFH
mmetsp:Transcript_151975/g.279604  ORF Transcript_151975/g.279604 Transcript_151975/m.279604 type:complete len:224 (+) Transcript_151975:129-800(+)